MCWLKCVGHETPIPPGQHRLWWPRFESPPESPVVSRGLWGWVSGAGHKLALRGFVEGTVVVIDLDRFGEVVRERGWSEWSPNEATGLLSSLVEWLARKWRGVVVYGLDWERGTEEAILEFPLTEPRELEADLKLIQERLSSEAGVTATIVAVRGYVAARPARDRREAYRGTPTRREAIRILRAAKRRGGGALVIVG